MSFRVYVLFDSISWRNVAFRRVSFYMQIRKISICPSRILFQSNSSFSSDGSNSTPKDKVKQRNLSKQQASKARGKTLSSTIWLRRQLSDPYVKRAREENLPSRSAFKLKEINKKHSFFQKGQVVLDLGSSPGGWSSIARDFVCGISGSGKCGLLIGVDLKEMNSIAGCHFVKGDFTLPETQKRIKFLLGERKVDVILSDMAPSSSGHNDLDHSRLMNLNNSCLLFALQVLNNGGSMLLKASRGGQEIKLRNKLAVHFDSVSFEKPPSSRSDSTEIYLLALRFRQNSN